MIDSNTIMLDSCLVQEDKEQCIVVFDDKSNALDQIARLCIWLIYLKRTPVHIITSDKVINYNVLQHLDLLDISFLTGNGRPPELMASRFIEMMLKKQNEGLNELKKKMEVIQQYKKQKSYDTKVYGEGLAIQHLIDDLKEKDEFYTRVAFHYILKKAITEPFHEIISLKVSGDESKFIDSDRNVTCIYLEQFPDTRLTCSNYIIGYSDRFRREAEKLSSSDQFSFQYNGSLLIRSSYGRNESNVLSGNQKSMYFGRALHDLNASYRIYELKNLSIISFLGTSNSDNMASLLERESAKEISLNLPEENLLPGVLSNSNKKKVLLLEEGCIDPGQTDTIIDQLRLIKKLSLSNIRCQSLFQYDIMKAGKEAFYDIVRIISALNQH